MHFGEPIKEDFSLVGDGAEFRQATCESPDGVEYASAAVREARAKFCSEAGDLLAESGVLIRALEKNAGLTAATELLVQKIQKILALAEKFENAQKIISVSIAFEKLVNALRSGKINPSEGLTEVLLQSADAVRSLVADFQNLRTPAINVTPLVQALNLWTDGRAGDGGHLAAPMPETPPAEKTWNAQILLVESCGHEIIIPVCDISGIFAFREVKLSEVNGRPLCEYEGSTIPFGNYRRFLESGRHPEELSDVEADPLSMVVILNHTDRFVALQVDRICDQCETLIRPFEHDFEKVRGFAGTSVLDSERIAFVIDADVLTASAFVM